MSNSTTALAVIGLKAIEHNTARAARKEAEKTLSLAYDEWKDAHGFERVERATPEWVSMLKATATEYQAVLAAKRVERNAIDRLSRACRRVP